MTWEQASTVAELAEPLTFTTAHFADVIAGLRPDPASAHPQPGWPPG